MNECNAVTLIITDSRQYVILHYPDLHKTANVHQVNAGGAALTTEAMLQERKKYV